MFMQEVYGWTYKELDFLRLNKDKYTECLTKAEYERVQLQQDRKNKRSDFLSSFDDDSEALLAIKYANSFKQFKKILIIGTGGSSLGGKALSYPINESRLIFLDNCDPHTVDNLLRNLDFTSTGLLVISKSGETIETLSLTDIFLPYFVSYGNVQKQSLIITEKSGSSLAKIGNKYNIIVLQHTKGVTGRFSALTLTGLLPFALAGGDPIEIKKQAIVALDLALNTPNSDIVQGSAAYFTLQKEVGISSHALIAYGDKLQPLTYWFRQLWAESLGKNGIQAVPLTGLGAVDQHSQLQMWIDGPKNIAFTVILPDSTNQGPVVSNSIDVPSYLQGNTVGDILYSMGEATISSLKNANKPVRVWKVKNSNVNVVVTSMVNIMLETIIVAKLFDIDAYSQPAVEDGKQMAKDWLYKNTK